MRQDPLVLLSLSKQQALLAMLNQLAAEPQLTARSKAWTPRASGTMKSLATTATAVRLSCTSPRLSIISRWRTKQLTSKYLLFLFVYLAKRLLLTTLRIVALDASNDLGPSPHLSRTWKLDGLSVLSV